MVNNEFNIAHIVYEKILCIVISNANDLTEILMQSYNKDIVLGLIFIIGIWCFLSAQFIFSTLLFAAAAIYSNMTPHVNLNR